jgi:hypothetical protein
LTENVGVRTRLELCRRWATVVGYHTTILVGLPELQLPVKNDDSESIAISLDRDARLQPDLESRYTSTPIRVLGPVPLQRSLSVFFSFSTAALAVLLVRASSPQASQSAAVSSSSATPLILQENDGEHRLRRPGGPTGSSSVAEFIIKIDKQNGNAQDFYVGYEILNPGAMIPVHKHTIPKRWSLLKKAI